MKILMVNKFLHPNGGSETYIFELGKYLNTNGHEVQFFGMEHPDRVVGNHAESYTADMDFHTGKWQRLLYPFKILYSTEARKKIRRVMWDFKPDVVHLNNINFQLTPSIIYEVRKYEKKRGKKVPLVYTAHDYQWICPNHMLRIPSTGELCNRCMEEGFGACARNRCIHNSRIKSILGTMEADLYKVLKTYQYVDTIICPSRFMKEKLDQYPVLRGKTMALHNFMEKSEEEADRTEKAGDYVLYFGRYTEEKGVKTLLSVCRQLPDIPFVFAGGGDLAEEIQALPNATDRGFLQKEELKQVIRQARFTVFTSEWYDNCPFSVMETQMYTTPILAAAIGGTPELVEEGRTGEFYESGNALALKEGILRLWNDPARCLEYRQNCRHIHFDTLPEYVEKLLQIYEGKRG